MTKDLLAFFHPGRLSRKLLRVVFALYFAVTITVTLFHFAAEYVRTQGVIRDELHQLEKTVHGPMATSLWQLNRIQLNALANGLVNMPVIDRVEVLDPDGKAMIELKNYTSDSTPLSLFSIEEPLTWRLADKQIALGTLRLWSSSDVIFDRVLFGFSVIALNAVIKITVLWYLFLWAFRRFLGKPLQKLMSQVNKIQLDKIGDERIDLEVKDDNELHRLQEHINLMLSKMEQDRQAMLSVERGQRALLEKQVAERTEALVILNKKLAEVASVDDLTGIHNRRGFFEKAQFLLDLVRRQNKPLSVLALDIDYFKKINDAYGHEAGDQALCHFTDLIASQLRQSDVFGRVGGEEFVIVLGDTNLEGGRHLAEKLCRLVHDTPLEVEGESLHISVSIGVVERTPSETDVEGLLKRADALLYKAKDNGRNRVEV